MKTISVVPVSPSYRNWVLNAEQSRQQIEVITRETVGTAECPIVGVPFAENLE